MHKIEDAFYHHLHHKFYRAQYRQY